MTRVERPVKTARADGTEGEEGDESELPSGMDEEEDEGDRREFIGEDESEAAPAAID